MNGTPAADRPADADLGADHSDRATDQGSERAERSTEAEVTTSKPPRQPKADPAPGKPAGEWRVEDLPTGAQKMISDLRKEAGDHRVAAKTAQAQAEETSAKLDAFLDGFARVMGLTQDTQAAPPDPEKLTADLETAQKSHREALVRLAVFEAATEHGGNARALTDSVSFLGKVNKLDPGSEEFSDRVNEAVREAVNSNPLFKAAGQAPAPVAPAAPSGGQFAGGPGRSPDPESMSVEDFREALKKQRRPT